MDEASPVNILVTGGGTGGHLIPALAVSAALKRRGAEVLVVGSRRAEDRELAEGAGFAFRAITAGKFRRYAALSTVLEPFRVVAGLFQSIGIISRFKPRIVFAKGGFVSLPVIWAARLRRIPVVIHESDTVPGLANRWGARHAKKIAVAWPTEQIEGLPNDKLVRTGNPLAAGVTKGKGAEAAARFKLAKQLPTVLALGGSQGSVPLNRLIVAALPELLSEGQVVHQVGERSAKEVAAWQQSLPAELRRRYHPQGYFGPELYDLYAVSDLVVARAGAGTLAELAATGNASILVPLPSAAGDHQRRNAAVFERAGAAVVLEQDALTPAELARQIKLLLHNSQRRTELGRAAKSLAVPDATEQVAGLVWETAHG